MLEPAPILLPVIGLVIWTLVMQGWMVVTRVPAISAAKLGPEAGQRTAELAAMLPKEVQWKADNYNHLMEQPTIFYAVALALAIAGMGDGLNMMLAWFYLGSRVVHSFVQSTTNNVTIRFSLFLLGTIAVLAMAINGVISLL
ncbi:MAG: MAPEG family protein [Gammaproteobacteria bacterium]|nr:MAPEG family protein [Gammaproteobacteria bacterium]